jgi:putative FmdB family regulatory protein
MPLFDYQCKVCGNIDEKLLFGRETEEQKYCSECGKESKQIVSKTHFKLEYNNKTDMCSWGNEGYASSQYWNDVKAARSRGEKVKATGEI